jgi:hypothetical protein
MTVCAAVICQGQTPTGEPEEVLLGVSDRMITAGGTEFETHLTKIFVFASAKIVALGAGDWSFIEAIATETEREVVRSQITDVQQVARLYGQNYARLRRRFAENLHLAPIGLDLDTFLERQRTMAPSLVSDLEARLQDVELGVNAIVAGVDASGPHIYSVGDAKFVGGQVRESCHERCHDSTGFYAVGAGRDPFDKELMALRYSRVWPWPEALLLTYSAKKKAEASTGVGGVTDLFCMDGEMLRFTSDTLQTLDQYYEELRQTALQKITELAGRIRTHPCFTAMAHEQGSNPQGASSPQQ